ncbi:MAG TPA: mechanosensitive ion channel family protein [Methanomicrobiales archaeon]|jgi:small-conductance mechanosensitive channel|nr:mechanosensitive ion channel family protein [Methanomicrobiales archaeon]
MDVRYIFALATLLAGILCAGIAHFVLRWLRQKAEKTKTMLDDIFLQSTERPIIAFILVTTIVITLTSFEVVPPTFGWVTGHPLIYSVYILIGAWFTSHLLYNLISTYGKRLARRTDPDFNERFIPLLEMGARYVTWFVAFLLILRAFQVDITPFLAGAGIAGLAVALAAQDILGNFLSGAIITLDKPFKEGDLIKYENFLGNVVSVGPRSTRIRTMDNQIVTIPNTKITSNAITNYAMPDIRLKVRVPVSVAYNSDVRKVKEILLAIAREAAEKTPWVLADPGPAAYFLEFGESGLSCQLVLWARNYDDSWDVQDWVNLRIDERFREEGIEIPFRQLDVRMRT